jgi:hypothetical protein
LLQTESNDTYTVGEFQEQTLNLIVFQSCGQPLTIEPWSIPDGFGVEAQVTQAVTFWAPIPLTIEAEVQAGTYPLEFRVSGCGDPVFVTFNVTLVE